MRFHMKLYIICISLMLLLLLSLIVELYFSEFTMVKFICLYIGVLLTVYIFIDYFQEKDKQKQYTQNKKIDYVNWAQPKQNAKQVASYYFKKRQ